MIRKIAPIIVFSHSYYFKCGALKILKKEKSKKGSTNFTNFTRNVTQLINENKYLRKFNTLFFQEFSHSCYFEIPNFKYWCFKHT